VSDGSAAFNCADCLTAIAARNAQHERFYLTSAPRNYPMAHTMNALVAPFLDEPWR
jgi:hypothetical protein